MTRTLGVEYVPEIFLANPVRAFLSRASPKLDFDERAPGIARRF